ncbi:MAG: ABC transporter ATP-binding protein [Deltaproteobacteria bacterium]|nr:ABC transporter ATP-binding protein [Deltaproteobacteria bacterium]
MSAFIEVKDLVKIYRTGDCGFPALKGVSLQIERGEFAAVMGPSGSGKSTFMNIIGCLDTAANGFYFLDGQDVSKLTRDAQAEIRNKKIGFVFQSFNLLARVTALENVILPLKYTASVSRKDREKALESMKDVGLTGMEHRMPNQLSGGQQQRVAIARALVNNPSLILADEPTGNLDSQTSIEIMGIFQRLNQENDITIIMVTHEHDIADYAKRQVLFKDGLIVRDEKTTGKGFSPTTK